MLVALGWDAHGAQIAQLACADGTVLCMSCVQVAEAYAQAVDVVLPLLSMHPDLGSDVRALKQELVAAQVASVGSVEEAFRGLLFVLILRELVLRVAAPGTDIAAE